MSRLALAWIPVVLLVVPDFVIARTWTDKNGNVIEAKLVRVHLDRVILQRSNRVLTVPFSALSAEDQQFIRQTLGEKGVHLLPPPEADGGDTENEDARQTVSPAAVPNRPAVGRSAESTTSETGPAASSFVDSPESPASTTFRAWTDDTGKHTIQAEFVDSRSGTVRLRTSEGRIITLPLAKLSEQSQQFVREQTASEDVSRNESRMEEASSNAVAAERASSDEVSVSTRSAEKSLSRNEPSTEETSSNAVAERASSDEASVSTRSAEKSSDDESAADGAASAQHASTQVEAKEEEAGSGGPDKGLGWFWISVVVGGVFLAGSWGVYHWISRARDDPSGTVSFWAAIRESAQGILAGIGRLGQKTRSEEQPSEEPSASTTKPSKRPSDDHAAEAYEERVKCPGCGGIFDKQTTEQIRKLVSLNLPEGTMRCPKCNAAVGASNFVRLSARTHCPLCNAPLDTQTKELINNLERLGINVTGAKCLSCGGSFGSKDF